MKITVTGANGYIGRHVVKALLDKGAQVVACDIDCSKIDDRAECRALDIFNLPDGNPWVLLGSPDVCLHMAWRNGFVHNSPTHIGDLSAHYKFLTAMIDGGLKRLAVMGSMHEAGYWEGAIDENTPCNPSSEYAIAKDALRKALFQYTKTRDCLLQWLRCYYVVGDDLRSNSIFCKLLKAAGEGKKTFPFTSGKNKYDFLRIDELAGMISAAVMQSDVAGIIECCSGTPVSLAEKVESFIRENDLDIRLEYGTYPDRPYDSPCIYGDASKIRRILDAEARKL